MIDKRRDKRAKLERLYAACTEAVVAINEVLTLRQNTAAWVQFPEEAAAKLRIALFKLPLEPGAEKERDILKEMMPLLRREEAGEQLFNGLDRFLEAAQTHLERIEKSI